MADRWDRGLAVLLTLLAVILHATFFASAGGLWRDEANSIHQARLAGWNELWGSLKHDSFPILYPALLRIWSSLSWTASDAGLRLFGFLVGLANLATFWAIARLLNVSFPIATLIFLALNPVMIVEGDSIRPYGLSILFIVWTYALLGRCIGEPRGVHLGLAALMAVLSVQSSYTNAVLVAVCTVCSVFASLIQRRGASAWKLLLPAMCAAFSLLPYVETLRAAGTWASIVHDKTVWGEVFRQIAGPAGKAAPVFLAIWIVIFSLPALFLAGVMKDRQTGGAPSPLLLYSASAAVLALLCQIAFLLATDAVPFLRYFLGCLAFAALAVELFLRERSPGLLRAAAATVLLLTAWPTWSWTRLLRTNADVLAAVIESGARAQDVVIIAPWFLNTSFQRYYHGAAPWVTIPDLEKHPMIRYDLIKLKILDGDSNRNLGDLLDRVFKADGSVWFVSQPYLENVTGRQRPLRPEASPSPNGGDYVRFRTFWELDGKYLLASAAAGQVVALPGERRIWCEERLVLTRWQRRKH